MKSVFFDVDTQIDFLYPAGALYVRGAERIVGRVAELNRYAAAHGIPVVSTMDAHAEDDPEFREWPAHCVAGTAGQWKPSSTLLERRVTIPNRICHWNPEGAAQFLLEKQTTDVFQTSTVRTALEALAADRYVVYGVVTEICVRSAVLGLLATGKEVALVTDAVEALSSEASQRTLSEIQAWGGTLVTLNQICVR